MARRACDRANARFTRGAVRRPQRHVGAGFATSPIMRVICLGLLLMTSIAEAQVQEQVQDLGHRLPAGAGIDAGTQVDQGLYLGDRFVWFASSQLRDRHGDVVSVENLDIDAYANVFGIAGTKNLDGLYLSAALAIPIVKLSLESDNPVASVDRLGLGDVFVEPLKLGGRFSHVDVVGSYSAYVPTSQGAHTGIGHPQWSHQFAAGGTVFFGDDRRDWRFSALASYAHNGKKRGIDITRGDTLQIQGGVGGRVFDQVELGIAGYALRQVSDDRGPDLPVQLRGARERAFGLGPEIDVMVPALRSRLTAQFAWDFDGKARPVGTIFVLGLSVVAWR
jgi:hypothetical protein